MATPSLSPHQRRILQSLVELVDDETPIVSGAEIAADVGRNPGTIRNQMQSLSALQLVEGIPGPRGGYKPTAAAYRALDRERLDDPADVPVEQDGQSIHGVTVEKIDFTTVHNPNLCRADVTVRGVVQHFSPGDHVTLGPTPSTDLRISGTVDGVEPDSNTIVLDVDRMNTPAEHLTAD
jgi:predicted transcriptional regulator